MLVVGLFLAYFAWALDHVNEGIWPATVLSAKYQRVMAGYNHMRTTDATINPADPVHGDLVAVLEDSFEELPGPISREEDIVLQEYKHWSVSTNGPVLDLVVTLEDGTTATLRGPDLEPAIRQMYLDSPIFQRTTLVFGFGLVFGLVGGLLGIRLPRYRKKRKRGRQSVKNSGIVDVSLDGAVQLKTGIGNIVIKEGRVDITWVDEEKTRECFEFAVDKRRFAFTLKLSGALELETPNARVRGVAYYSESMGGTLHLDFEQDLM